MKRNPAPSLPPEKNIFKKHGGGGLDRRTASFLLRRLLGLSLLLLVEAPSEVPREDPLHGEEPRNLVIVHLCVGQLVRLPSTLDRVEDRVLHRQLR